MSGKTNIEWTDATWSPTRGCSEVSSGCANCYARPLAARLFGDAMLGRGFATRSGGRTHWTGRVAIAEDKLLWPLRWRGAPVARAQGRPSRICVSSTSDIFHEALPDEDIDRVFAVMALSPEHTFQVLTKRPERMLAYLTQSRRNIPVYNAATAFIDGDFSRMPGDMARTRSSGGSWWPLPNVWLGVSVEDQPTADERIPLLLQTPAARRFVSYEPALGPVDFERITESAATSMTGRIAIDALTGYRACFVDGDEKPLREVPGLCQVIVGGESGPGARPCDVAWVRSTIAQCRAAGVACFVKQLGARPYSQPTYKDGSIVGGVVMGLRDRKGGDPSEWPEDLRVREFPAVRS